MRKYIEITREYSRSFIILSYLDSYKFKRGQQRYRVLQNVKIEKVIKNKVFFIRMKEEKHYNRPVLGFVWHDSIEKYRNVELTKGLFFNEIYLVSETFNEASRLSFDNDDDAKLYLEVL